MSPYILLLIIGLYFLLLLGISKLVEKNSDDSSFFTGNKKSPWYLVAFGMIGASLSGVTFVSVPGAVAIGSFSYFQMVLGFTVGYIVIALVLLPVYYKLKLTTIYGYLDQRYGRNAQLVGSGFFMLSRVIGASLRMYLVVLTLQTFVFDQLNIHFSITIAVSLALIWVYTSKAGIKTIVYTDTLQTAFMLIALVCTILFILNHYDFNLGTIWNGLSSTKTWGSGTDGNSVTKTFFWDNLTAGNTFWKQFIGGAAIAIAMTGLDQDMMQKNLTCPDIKEAKKNVFSFTIVLVFVNALFLLMGALLYYYAVNEGIELTTFDVENATGEIITKLRTDLIYPDLAMKYFHPVLGVIFFVGLIAAAYSSADSALTSLTTSFCYDIKKWDNEKIKANKTIVHIGFTVILYVVITIFCLWNEKSAISTLFTLAGYTYGPLIGIFFFGILTKVSVKDNLLPIICIASPIISYLISWSSTTYLEYSWGHELLLLNGLITFILLFTISRPEEKTI